MPLPTKQLGHGGVASVFQRPNEKSIAYFARLASQSTDCNTSLARSADWARIDFDQSSAKCVPLCRPKPLAGRKANLPRPRLIDQVRESIRLEHYSLRTEQAYVDWIKRYIRFQGNRHPSELGSRDLVAFLTHLATDRNVAASTQNQAQSALLFLYREVLALELPMLEGVKRAKTPARLPVVLTKPEVAALLGRLSGVHRLLGQLLYGSGLRIMAGVRLRVKDVDLHQRAILVRDGKGAKDRVTMLADRRVPALRRHLAGVRQLHERDLRDGFGTVWLPTALARKVTWRGA